MEGVAFSIAVLVAIAVAFFGSRRKRKQGPVQTSEPPKPTSAPDDWPRDGGDNPRAP